MTGSLASLGLASVAGGGFTLFGQTAIGWLAARADRHRSDRQADVAIDAQQNKLTFDLLAAARSDSEAVRGELADFRVISARAVHLEQALDHIEEMLTADSIASRRNAEKRARVFLARMRPTVGDIRQELQKGESAKRVVRDAEGELP